MSTVVVFAEQDEEGLLDASLRATTFARALLPPAAELVICAFGPLAPQSARRAAEYGAARLYAVTADAYRPRAFGAALASLADQLEAVAVVAAGSDRGQEVLAHLAALTGEEMVANCTAANAVEVDDGGLPASWRIVRQRWGGSLVEHARLNAARAILTVATDEIAPAPAPEPLPQPALVTAIEPEGEPDGLAVAAVESKAAAGGVSLASAKVVVSGGRGVGGEAGFSVLEELAGLLGGAVGVSRVVTSLGWRPHSQQVGQTGTRVAPDLYLACGISGAIQHLAGCQGAKHMIAINTDPDAPIMARADYAVIGDLHEVLPALVAALRERAARA